MQDDFLDSGVASSAVLERLRPLEAGEGTAEEETGKAVYRVQFGRASIYIPLGISWEEMVS